MKGIGKAFSRTPHMLTSKVGMSKKSVDPVFDDYLRSFKALEDSAEKFIKDARLFTEAVVSLFTAGTGFSTHFAMIFNPIAGEYNLAGKHSESRQTLQSVDGWNSCMEELQSAVAPELDLIDTRIIAPLKEFQGVLKTINKTITKRDHKLLDYDRFNNSLMKLRDKKEKSLSDEKNLFKLEQDFEIATNEYDAINTALKTDLPRFLTLTTAFVDPLFHSFFYMQLNVYYMLLEKTQAFADGKYDVSNVPGANIQADYESKRTDAWEQIEELSITKRILSTQKLVQTRRQLAPPPPGGVNRSPSDGSVSSRPAVSRSTSSVSNSSFKKAPPPPPGASLSRSATSGSAAPPPYSAGGGSALASAAATKRAPPPPPPLKPKPSFAPPVQYVVALYDFVAQADGDLSFSTGDRIEIVERTASAEDWWTGRLNGAQGVFPGNYVQDT